MRNLLTIGFTLIMLIANLHQSMNYAFFKVNQPNIASDKCEMRSIEDNNCQGACVLRELLQPKDEKEHPISLLELKLDEYLSTFNYTSSLTTLAFIDSKPKSKDPLWLDKFLIFMIWRPPQNSASI